MNRKDRIIVALDFDSDTEAMSLVGKLKGKINFFKVGSQLFTRYGGAIVERIASLGADVFLDLKFHDIPNTVRGASLSACSLGVKIFNVHASGGRKMMEEAVNAAKKHKSSPLVLGVTVLTSMSSGDLCEIGVGGKVEEQVLRLASLAKEAGLDGVVASAKEIELIKKECGNDFIVLTPGIRPAWSSADDQKRVMTPEAAFNRGADYIVIGRAVTSAPDPVEAADRILGEL
ncbi:MAG: orotidine-5'-phosphate decarboxylase [Candidatus Aureabacteria bacterium]|nr:orotidine-5'-phosphate decarboxylase [Candidatus Auribacterota bacterium]